MTREELCIHACKYAIGELTRKGSCLFITSEHEGREQISWVAVVEWLNALEQEPCEDCISRQSAISLASDLKQDLPDDEHIVDMVMAHNEGILGYQTQLSLLPPVTPQLEKIRVANIHFDKEKFEEIMKNAHLTILDDSNTPTIQLIQPKTGHWIPISEELPQKNVEVLATTKWGELTIAEMYSANDWFIHEDATNAKTDGIVAWMSLPEPYKAESEG